MLKVRNKTYQQNTEGIKKPDQQNTGTEGKPTK